MSHITNFIIIMSFAIIFFIFFQLGDNMLLRLSLAVVNICFLMHLLFKYQKNIQKERVIRAHAIPTDFIYDDMIVRKGDLENNITEKVKCDEIPAADKI